ncbi:hypothetical protein ACFU93_42030 [Streptomyces sp. NPDC057611]|uniref:hypothetical protein n=1 Tax=Streptomyces sp. NPDC057611 TaxID=3346182 RepID=UPI0036814D75
MSLREQFVDQGGRCLGSDRLVRVPGRAVAPDRRPEVDGQEITGASFWDSLGQDREAAVVRSCSRLT